MTVTWESRLRAADSEQDLLSVVRDFFATWTPLEVAALPVDCRPWKVVEADDVMAFALHLAQRKWLADGDHGFLLARMRAFFGDASARLSAILAAAHEPPDTVIGQAPGRGLN